jgi:hypothetical protein
MANISIQEMVSNAARYNAIMAEVNADRLLKVIDKHASEELPLYYPQGTNCHYVDLYHVARWMENTCNSCTATLAALPKIGKLIIRFHSKYFKATHRTICLWQSQPKPPCENKVFKLTLGDIKEVIYNALATIRQDTITCYASWPFL